ncbi:molybdate ABC transporter substrate-binding protein [Pontiella sp.]|uniref:molybdate ABC transporter substrate-binding protein n=1 Tax=Pontiella sp. TaxID=2837462 RepID=UPI00356B5F30
MRITSTLITAFLCVQTMMAHAQAKQPLRVFAAAGTAPAMKEIAIRFTRQTGTPVIFNFANAGTLAKQIAAGAEFDVFFSANETWMDYVEDKGLVAPSSRTVLLEDEMVIVVPKGKPSDILLAAPAVDRFAIGDPATPIGIYAKQAFTKLGCWDALQPRLCVGDTVHKVLNYVALGEADAGVVFRSVARCASNRVDIACAIPGELHSPIRFPIATAQNSRAEDERFLEFILSPSATAIFSTYGWSPVKTKGPADGTLPAQKD